MAEKRTYAPEVTRERLLDAAYSQVQNLGYAGTTLAGVAKASGVTNGALFHHFGSKQQLAMAIIRERVSKSVEEYWLSPLRAAPSARDGVAIVLERIVDEISADGPVLGCPVNNISVELSLLDPAFRGALAELFETWRAIIAEKLKSDVAARQIAGSIDPRTLATLIIAAYEGAMTLARCFQSSAPLKDCAEQIDRYLATLKP